MHCTIGATGDKFPRVSLSQIISSCKMIYTWHGGGMEEEIEVSNDSNCSPNFTARGFGYSDIA